MKKENYRHGDVILKKVENLPDGAIEIPSEDRIVLAKGESTGHWHGFHDPSVGKLFKFEDKTYLKITKKEAKIDHEDHGPDIVRPDLFKIIIQKEWKETGWEKVID